MTPGDQELVARLLMNRQLRDHVVHSTESAGSPRRVAPELLDAVASLSIDDVQGLTRTATTSSAKRATRLRKAFPLTAECLELSGTPEAPLTTCIDAGGDGVDDVGLFERHVREICARLGPERAVALWDLLSYESAVQTLRASEAAVADARRARDIQGTAVPAKGLRLGRNCVTLRCSSDLFVSSRQIRSGLPALCEHLVERAYLLVLQADLTVSAACLDQRTIAALQMIRDGIKRVGGQIGVLEKLWTVGAIQINERGG
jgi:hypothetical protein